MSMIPHMRRGVAAIALVLATPAFAQTPMTPAGQMPTSAEQSVVPPLSDQEPARAPGTEGDKGKDLAPRSQESGTTTVYAVTEPKEEVRWPCPQQRVPTISIGTIWSGPDPSVGKGWEDDFELASLAQKLASRRTSLEEADQLIADFAQKAGADKDKRLTRLFVAVLDIINENRGKLLDGIMRYARGQERLAERMRDESDKISAAQEDAKAEGLGVAAQQTNRAYMWDQRIFKERTQALAYVCETPTILERRAYEIGKHIQAKL